MREFTVFSFDYDNTISRDPEGFLGVMDFLRNRGHAIYVVTARRPEIHPEDFEFLIDRGYKVIFTRHISKLKWMEEVEKIHVDVWVDDCPDAVLNNYHGEPRTHRDMEATQVKEKPFWFVPGVTTV